MRMFMLAAACVAALVAVVPPALAQDNPIPGIDVVVRPRPSGAALTMTSDSQGSVTFKGLAPGDYEIDIDGKSLKKAVCGDTSIGISASATVTCLYQGMPTTPEKKSGSSFSIGIGGSLFGGGGGRSSHSGGGQGAGPVQGGGGHGGSGGGVGVGLNIPLGGGDKGDTGKLQPVNLLIAILLPAVQQKQGLYSTSPVSAVGQQEIRVSLPYCPDAKGDVRLGFTVPEGGGTVQLSAQIQIAY